MKLAKHIYKINILLNLLIKTLVPRRLRKTQISKNKYFLNLNKAGH